MPYDVIALNHKKIIAKMKGSGAMKNEEEELIEEIIKIIRQFRDIQSIKMLYCFAKGLKERRSIV